MNKHFFELPKAAQREKAVQWNAVEVFNEIYA